MEPIQEGKPLTPLELAITVLAILSVMTILICGNGQEPSSRKLDGCGRRLALANAVEQVRLHVVRLASNAASQRETNVRQEIKAVDGA